MDAIVQVEKLRKVYGATVAVDEVSFEVKEGEIFGMVGPNGIGVEGPIEGTGWVIGWCKNCTS